MSATNRLRELLNERGVEWMPVAWNPQRETFYQAANGVGFCVNEYTGGVRIYTDATITPERAIEATLGGGAMRTQRAIDAEMMRSQGVKSRWERLFGTPERAAETMFTLMLNCARGDGPCERCPAYPRCNWASDDGEETESMMLEWLRDDAEVVD